MQPLFFVIFELFKNLGIFQDHNVILFFSSKIFFTANFVLGPLNQLNNLCIKKVEISNNF